MDSPPNILFVLADQLGARWLPTHGHPLVSTPQLQRFASQSTVFEGAITTSPICTPYRGCLLSGLYPSQTGVIENGQAFPSGVKSLAHHLNHRGYPTHYIGKWHLSGAPQENRRVRRDQRAGFQNFIGWESHHIDHCAGLIWSDDQDEAIDMPGHETDALTDLAIQQLERAASAGAPFFLMVSYQAPHPPCSPPPQYLQLYADQALLREPNADKDAWFKHEAWQADYDAARFRQLYFGEISHLDAAFGRLLDALERLGLHDDTLIVFTSDHGEMAGAHGLFGKGVMFEESLRVPLIIRAPAQVSGARTAFPATTIDLLPTLLDYADCQTESRFEGLSLRPHIECQAQAPERIVICEYHDFCATNGRWKLVTDGRTQIATSLFDIVIDPYELDNRLDDPACAGIQGELSRALADWHARVVRESLDQTALPRH